MVAVGTANFNDPMTTIKVIEGIQSFMKKNGIKDIAEITGCVK
jgi:dihydroorotate dehydrogenase (NAD+) catalytic subunit